MNIEPTNTTLESQKIDPDALSKEIARALEMMKRVKKSNAGVAPVPSETQPTFLIPDEPVLCQSAC
jgi:hypothetical protein